MSLLLLWVRPNRWVRRPLQVASAPRPAVHPWVALLSRAVSGLRLAVLPNLEASVRPRAVASVGLRPPRRLLRIRTVPHLLPPWLLPRVSSTSPSTLWVAPWSRIRVRSIPTANLRKVDLAARLAALLQVVVTVVLLLVVAMVRLIRAVLQLVAVTVVPPLAAVTVVPPPAAPAVTALLLLPAVATVALLPVAATALRRAAATALPPQHPWAATAACRAAARRWSQRVVAVRSAKLEIRSWCW